MYPSQQLQKQPGRCGALVAERAAVFKGRGLYQTRKGAHSVANIVLRLGRSTSLRSNWLMAPLKVIGMAFDLPQSHV
jgi:hypothetical protein